MSWSGIPRPEGGDFHLLAGGCPPNQPLLFFYGPAVASAPFGNGARCVGSGGVGLFRFTPLVTDASGTAALAIDFSQPPVGSGSGPSSPGRWEVGDTWYCQGWYRDPAGGGASFNMTDGLKVEVCPNVNPNSYDGMALIPGGSYQMGRHVGTGHARELPVHSVTLDDFYMDVYEITNREYADYLNSAYTHGRVTVVGNEVRQSGWTERVLCETAQGSPYSHITWDGSVFDVENPSHEDQRPMVYVTWYGACTYANQRSRDNGLTPSYDELTWVCDYDADGYRLATEAEWEYAARGGEHSPYLMYPWGNTIDGSQANYWMSGDPYEQSSSPWTTPIGYYDGTQMPAGADMANGYGLYDMVGNVLEWCGDWSWDSYYSISTSDNPTGPVSGSWRVVRGGSWAGVSSDQRSAMRYSSAPLVLRLDLGFRLVAR